MSHDADLYQIDVAAESLKATTLKHLAEHDFLPMGCTITLCHVQFSVDVFFATRRVEVEAILNLGNVREKTSIDSPDSLVANHASNADAAQKGFQVCASKLLGNLTFIAEREAAELDAVAPSAPAGDDPPRV